MSILFIKLYLTYLDPAYIIANMLVCCCISVYYVFTKVIIGAQFFRPYIFRKLNVCISMFYSSYILLTLRNFSVSLRNFSDATILNSYLSSIIEVTTRKSSLRCAIFPTSYNSMYNQFIISALRRTIFINAAQFFRPYILRILSVCISMFYSSYIWLTLRNFSDVTILNSYLSSIIEVTTRKSSLRCAIFPTSCNRILTVLIIKPLQLFELINAAQFFQYFKTSNIPSLLPDNYTYSYSLTTRSFSRINKV